jgi:dTDP-L-rhamnose 4-epimerase
LEDVALRLGEAFGVAATILRFGLTYGSRQSATNPYCGIIPLFSQRMLRGKPVLLYEDGAQTRDFIHVSDVARANLLVAESEASIGGIYNVGTGTGTAVLEIVQRLANLLGVEADIRLPGWYRLGEVRDLWPDPARLRALGWSAEVGQGEGLSEFVDWFRRRSLADDPLPAGLRAMQVDGIVQRSRYAGDVFDEPEQPGIAAS